MIKNEFYKGDIYYADLNPIVGSEQSGTRPVVIVQNDIANKYSPTLIVAPITSVNKKLELKSHILIPYNNGLYRNSVVLVEQIRTIDKCRLNNYLGRLSISDIRRIDSALIDMLDIKGEEYVKNI